jgi:hypothetical protein
MGNDYVTENKELNKGIRLIQQHQIYMFKVMTAYLYEVHIRVKSLGDRIAELAQELFLRDGLIMMGVVRVVMMMMIMM